MNHDSSQFSNGNRGKLRWVDGGQVSLMGDYSRDGHGPYLDKDQMFANSPLVGGTCASKRIIGASGGGYRDGFTEGYMAGLRGTLEMEAGQQSTCMRSYGDNGMSRIAEQQPHEIFREDFIKQPRGSFKEDFIEQPCGSFREDFLQQPCGNLKDIKQTNGCFREDIRPPYGDYREDIKQLYGGFREDIRQPYGGGFREDIKQQSYGGFREDIRQPYGGSFREDIKQQPYSDFRENIEQPYGCFREGIKRQPYVGFREDLKQPYGGFREDIKQQPYGGFREDLKQPYGGFREDIKQPYGGLMSGGTREDIKNKLYVSHRGGGGRPVCGPNHGSWEQPTENTPKAVLGYLSIHNMKEGKSGKFLISFINFLVRTRLSHTAAPIVYSANVNATNLEVLFPSAALLRAVVEKFSPVMYTKEDITVYVTYKPPVPNFTSKTLAQKKTQRQLKQLQRIRQHQQQNKPQQHQKQRQQQQLPSLQQQQQKPSQQQQQSKKLIHVRSKKRPQQVNDPDAREQDTRDNEAGEHEVYKQDTNERDTSEEDSDEQDTSEECSNEKSAREFDVMKDTISQEVCEIKDQEDDVDRLSSHLKEQGRI